MGSICDPTLPTLSRSTKPAPSPCPKGSDSDKIKKKKAIPVPTTGIATSSAVEPKKAKAAAAASAADSPHPVYLRLLCTTVDGVTVYFSPCLPLPPGGSPPELILVEEKHLIKGDEQLVAEARNSSSFSTDKHADPEERKEGRNWRRKKLPAEQQQEEEHVEGLGLGQSNGESTKKRKQQLNGLSPGQMEAYRRVGKDCTWKPPPESPFHLLQEQHFFDPWRVLVISILLNQTSGSQVKKVLPSLFHLCPNANIASKVADEELKVVIMSLGFQNRRTQMIKKFSQEYLESGWTHVSQLPGINRYAADAYAIFCAGKAGLITPHDHKLLPYWKYVLREMNKHSIAALAEADEYT